MRSIRRGMVPVLLTAVLSTVTGCGGDDGPPRPTASPSLDVRTAAALRGVERATARAGSARIRSTTVMAGLLSTRSEGALDWAGESTGTLSITYTGGSLAEPLRALGSTTMEARLLPEAYYARVGAEFARRIGGRHWIRYAYDDLAELPDDSGSHLRDQLRNTAPVPPLKLLLAAGDARAMGEETVAGRRTRHYRGTVDVAALTDAALKKQLTDAGVTGEHIDLWVDEHDLLVKKTEKAEMSTGVMTQTATYDDYGVRVAVQRPPAADTKDFADLMGPTSS
ncbi:hypothetical protein C3489_10045 [Streptomyces sp. Ru71]|uniref:hypothetical protein n=1 Tax=Streptomyces sp. Ru71 TaxID=2080746 RepID=UPI000CDDFB29|nr:hypothetical protein [Streptomyces sp. Ru71]POX55388.1 hypothetical protein C3489_10045 [Streptomyces sp. Ru71]